MEHSSRAEPPTPALPTRLDCETAALIRGFLRPIFEKALSWSDLCTRLAARGYDIEFRDGRLVIMARESNRPVCTGRDIGEPLSELSIRLGRPQLKLGRDGRKGWLA